MRQLVYDWDMPLIRGVKESLPCSAADIALSPVVPSHGDHGAIGLKPHGVTLACGDLGDVLPAVDIALPLIVASHGDHSAVGLNPHRVKVAYIERA